MRLLVMEDEPLPLKSLTQQLENLGSSDLTARQHPQSALDSLRVEADHLHWPRVVDRHQILAKHLDDFIKAPDKVVVRSPVVRLKPNLIGARVFGTICWEFLRTVLPMSQEPTRARQKGRVAHDTEVRMDCAPDSTGPDPAWDLVWPKAEP